MHNKINDLKPRGIKPPLALIPAAPLWAIADVFAYGAKKYAPWSWANQVSGDWRETYLSAALRHLTLAADPHEPDIDDESGKSHLAMAATNIVIALFHELRSGQAVEAGKVDADGSEAVKFENVLISRASNGRVCVTTLLQRFGRLWEIGEDNKNAIYSQNGCIGPSYINGLCALNWQSDEPQRFCDWVNSLTDDQIKQLDAKYFGNAE